MVQDELVIAVVELDEFRPVEQSVFFDFEVDEKCLTVFFKVACI